MENKCSVFGLMVAMMVAAGNGWTANLDGTEGRLLANNADIVACLEIDDVPAAAADGQSDDDYSVAPPEDVPCIDEPKEDDESLTNAVEAAQDGLVAEAVPVDVISRIPVDVVEAIPTNAVAEVVQPEPVVEAIPTNAVAEVVQPEPVIEAVPTNTVVEVVQPEPVVEAVPTNTVVEVVQPEPAVEVVQPVVEEVPYRLTSAEAWTNILQEAERKFGCVIVRVCGDSESPLWKAGSGKDLIIDHSGTQASIPFAEKFDRSGRLFKMGPAREFRELVWLDAKYEELVKPIEEEERKTRESVLAAEAARAAAEERARIEAEEKARAEEERARAEKEKAEKERSVAEANERRRIEREAKVREAAVAWNEKVDAMLDDFFGLEFGMTTNELERVKGRMYKLPRRFRDYENVICHDVDGVIYEFILQCPYGSDCASVAVSDEAMRVKSIIGEKLESRLEWDSSDSRIGRKTVTCGWRMDVRFEDSALRQDLLNRRIEGR